MNNTNDRKEKVTISNRATKDNSDIKNSRKAISISLSEKDINEIDKIAKAMNRSLSQQIAHMTRIAMRYEREYLEALRRNNQLIPIDEDVR